MLRIILPKMVFRLEKWKWNKEYRIYESTLGNFKDEYKKNMPVYTGNNGYLSIKTPYGFKLAHRMVMLTWRPIPNAEELTVDHLNHNKRDNSLYNLEWVSKEENWARAERDQLCHVAKKTGTIPGSSKKCPLVFENIDDAFAWLLANDKAFGNQPNLNHDSVKNKILKASRQKEVYARRYWQVNNIEN